MIIILTRYLYDFQGFYALFLYLIYTTVGIIFVTLFYTTIVSLEYYKAILYICIYRLAKWPGTDKVIPLTLFFSEFQSLVERASMIQEKLIFGGDFNLHIDCASEGYTIKFFDIYSVHLISRKE